MKWSSAVSDNVSLTEAVTQCATEIRKELGDSSPDLATVFVSAHHFDGYESVPQLVREHLGECMIIGCSGGGVIGNGKEIEHKPGFAMAAVNLPEVELTPFHIEDASLPDGDAPPDEWEALVGTRADRSPYFLLLADPFSLRADSLLGGLDFAFPGSVKIGGLASGGNRPEANALYLGDTVYRSGAVGVAMHGNIEVDTIVAQGCRPIGQPMHITNCNRNVLLEVDGQTPFEVLREIFERLNERDRELAQHSLFLGVVMDELNDNPKLGDYLIRNIMNIDPRQGALTIGEMLKEGQTVQFHLRDSDTSSQDLNAMLNQYVSANPIHEQAGALLFSCLGRGSDLYGRPDHDTDMFREKVGSMPLTGFFCNGEIGQVGGSTYLHGYTSSFGIFRPKRGE